MKSSTMWCGRINQQVSGKMWNQELSEFDSQSGSVCKLSTITE